MRSSRVKSFPAQFSVCEWHRCIELGVGSYWGRSRNQVECFSFLLPMLTAVNRHLLLVTTVSLYFLMHTSGMQGADTGCRKSASAQGIQNHVILVLIRLFYSSGLKKKRKLSVSTLYLSPLGRNVGVFFLLLFVYFWFWFIFVVVIGELKAEQWIGMGKHVSYIALTQKNCRRKKIGYSI